MGSDMVTSKLLSALLSVMGQYMDTSTLRNWKQHVIIITRNHITVATLINTTTTVDTTTIIGSNTAAHTTATVDTTTIIGTNTAASAQV